MATITHNLMVCDDCVQILANAATSEDTGSETTDIAAEALAQNWPGVSVVLSSTDEEDRVDFGTSPCEGCGSRDAGGRSPAVVFDA